MRKRWMTMILAGILTVTTVGSDWVLAAGMDEIAAEEIGEFSDGAGAADASEGEQLSDIAGEVTETASGDNSSEEGDALTEEALPEETATAEDASVQEMEIEAETEQSDLAGEEAQDIVLEEETDAAGLQETDAASAEEAFSDGDVPAAGAETETSGDFSYTVTSKKATITKYNGSDANVVIPGTIGSNGYTVEAIGKSAFQGNENLVSVTIPASVKTVGDSAFQKCSCLESVTFKENSKTGFTVTIGISAFEYCEMLSDVKLTKNVVSIGNWAFGNCISMGSIDIPSGVKTVGSNAFANCTALSSVTFGKNVTTIDTQAFSGCTALTEITLPSGLKTLGNYVFKDTPISSMTIPKTLTSAGYYSAESAGPLAKMPELELVTLENGMTSVPAYLCANASMEKVILPNTIEIIGEDAFAYCSSLKALDLPSSLTCINKGAFGYCTKLSEVMLPSSLEKLGDSAFNNCTHLEKATFTQNSKTGFTVTIGISAFANCTMLYTIKLTKNVISIGNWAFNNCKTIENIDIPAGMKTVGSNAFTNCTALSSVTLGNTITTIDLLAFSGCTALTTITLPSSLKTLGYYAFKDTCITSITIPETLTSAGYYSAAAAGPLGGMAELETVELESGMTSVPDYLCSNATMKTLILPDTIETIGEYAFAHCSSLETVKLPSKLSTINKSAFSYCTKLAEVTLPSSLEKLDVDVFNNCTALEKVTFSRNSKTGFTVRVGNYAFGNCKMLTTVNLSINVVSIEYRAFMGCTSLEKITLPRGVKTLGNYVFEGCTALTTVETTSSITYAGEKVFYNCASELVIWGTEGSYMETYAAKYNIPFNKIKEGKSFTVYGELADVDVGNSTATIEGTVYTAADNFNYAIAKALLAENGGKVSVIGKVENGYLTKVESMKSFADNYLSLSVNVKPQANHGPLCELTWKNGSYSLKSWTAAVTVSLSLKENEYLSAETVDTDELSRTIEGIRVISNSKKLKLSGGASGFVAMSGGVELKKEFTLKPGESKTFTVNMKPVTEPAAVKENVSLTAYVKQKGGKWIKKNSAAVKLLNEDMGTISVNVRKLVLQVNQSTSAVKVTYGRSDKIVSWKSSNTNIAVVNSKGKITGKKVGRAAITVTLKSGKYAVITVNVQKTAVETTVLKLNKNFLTLKKGAAYQLAATVTPLTSKQKVTYKSSDSKIAAVSSKGKITAKKKGIAYISVTSGSKTVKCKVTVK